MDLMEILKALFGDEALTFEQFAEKVNNAADVKLGNLAGGQYVEKDKYDDVSNQLASANANLEGYDPDWQDKVKQAQAEGDKKLNDYKFEQAVESAINNAGAADLEFGRKAQLRRQLVALLQLSAADLLEHVVHDLLVVDAGFRFHCDTSLSNIHKFCVDFLRIVFIYKEKKEWYD